ncbi:MAG: transposase [Ignavibacteria bacterium]|nr:transposase [Ignavibacteria bacterium]
MNIKSYYRRNYPHFQISGQYYFVTSRLIDSIPEEINKMLKNNFLQEERMLLKKADSINFENERYFLMKKYFGYYDHYLNQALCGEKYLADERIAKIVYDSLLHFDGKLYDMLNFCLMPNHFHFLAKVGKLVNPFFRIMQSLKRYTSRQSNKILNRSGAFWEEESYDHIVRDEIELIRIIDYILMDPVRAGLTRNPFEWKWSYSKYQTFQKLNPADILNYSRITNP